MCNSPILIQLTRNKQTVRRQIRCRLVYTINIYIHQVLHYVHLPSPLLPSELPQLFCYPPFIQQGAGNIPLRFWWHSIDAAQQSV